MITQIIYTDTNQEMTRTEHLEFVKNNQVAQRFDRRTGVLHVRLATIAETESNVAWKERQAIENTEEWQIKQRRIAELKHTLASYSEDLLQAFAGICIFDIEERKVKFRAAYAELRQLEGKSPQR